MVATSSLVLRWGSDVPVVDLLVVTLACCCSQSHGAIGDVVVVLLHVVSIKKETSREWVYSESE